MAGSWFSLPRLATISATADRSRPGFVLGPWPDEVLYQGCPCDTQAVRAAALMGIGVADLGIADLLAYLQQGTLVCLLPEWYVDEGTISLYSTSRSQLPAKTWAYIKFISKAIECEGLACRLTTG